MPRFVHGFTEAWFAGIQDLSVYFLQSLGVLGPDQIVIGLAFDVLLLGKLAGGSIRSNVFAFIVFNPKEERQVLKRFKTTALHDKGLLRLVLVSLHSFFFLCPKTSTTWAVASTSPTSPSRMVELASQGRRST